MPYRLAIFDFDGTLADSFPWFLSIMDQMADEFRFRRITPEEVGALSSLESREIIRRLDVPMWKLPLIATHMRKLKR